MVSPLTCIWCVGTCSTLQESNSEELVLQCCDCYWGGTVLLLQPCCCVVDVMQLLSMAPVTLRYCFLRRYSRQETKVKVRNKHRTDIAEHSRSTKDIYYKSYTLNKKMKYRLVWYPKYRCLTHPYTAPCSQCLILLQAVQSLCELATACLVEPFQLVP